MPLLVFKLTDQVGRIPCGSQVPVTFLIVITCIQVFLGQLKYFLNFINYVSCWMKLRRKHQKLEKHKSINKLVTAVTMSKWELNRIWKVLKSLRWDHPLCNAKKRTKRSCIGGRREPAPAVFSATFISLLDLIKKHTETRRVEWNHSVLVTISEPLFKKCIRGFVSRKLRFYMASPVTRIYGGDFLERNEKTKKKKQSII